MAGILLENLNETVSKNLESIELLYSYSKEEIQILGKDEDENPNKKKKPAYFLEKVTINQLPKDNCWVFESETLKDKCLGAGGKTVERTILYLEEDRLYVLMIELKSKISDCNKLRKKVTDKFECSIARIAIFLASNVWFLSQKDVQIYPVGILCFNKDEYDILQGGTSNICKNFVQFKNNGKVNKGFTIEIQPVTLNILRIPILFFQNPAFIDNDDASEPQFTLTFEEIMHLL